MQQFQQTIPLMDAKDGTYIYFVNIVFKVRREPGKITLTRGHDSLEYGDRNQMWVLPLTPSEVKEHLKEKRFVRNSFNQRKKQFLSINAH